MSDSHKGTSTAAQGAVAPPNKGTKPGQGGNDAGLGGLGGLTPDFVGGNIPAPPSIDGFIPPPPSVTGTGEGGETGEGTDRPPPPPEVRGE